MVYSEMFAVMVGFGMIGQWLALYLAGKLGMVDHVLCFDCAGNNRGYFY